MALDIEFDVSGLGKAAKAFEDIAAKSEKTGKRVQSAVSGPYQRLERLQSASSQVAPGSAASRDVAAAIEATQKRIARIEQTVTAGPRVTGPYQRLESLKAAATGLDPTSDAGKDAAAATARTQRQIERMENPQTKTVKPPPNFMQKLGGVVSRSRIGEGGLMPLVGDIAKLLGPEGTAVALAVEGVGKLAEKIKEMGDAASESGRAFTSYGNATGGSGQNTALLQLLGVDSGLARSFNAKMNSDPYAMSTAMRAGLYNAPEPFGNVDEGKQLEKAVVFLRSIDNRQARIQQARMLGLESLLPLAQVSRGAFANSRGVAEGSADVNDEQFQTTAADWAQASKDFGTSAESLNNAMGRVWMPLVNKWVEGASLLTTWYAQYTKGFAQITGADWFNKILQGKTGGDKPDDAADQGKSFDALGRQLTLGNPGVYGDTSGRGQTFNPNTMGGYAFSKSLEAGGVRMGWF